MIELRKRSFQWSESLFINIMNEAQSLAYYDSSVSRQGKPVPIYLSHSKHFAGILAASIPQFLLESALVCPDDNTMSNTEQVPSVVTHSLKVSLLTRSGTGNCKFADCEQDRSPCLKKLDAGSSIVARKVTFRNRLKLFENLELFEIPG
jgi:hypothetical protein